MLEIYKLVCIETIMPKILAFAGSARKDSYNKKLVKIAALGAENTGADVTFIDLADFQMPLFDQDLEQEQGMPDSARAFKNLLIAHDGFLIASPEYNSAFSALLKNTIDWASRKETADEPALLAFQDKTAVIMAASPGALGGIRGLVFLRLLLGNIGVTVLPQQQAIPLAHKAFDDKGALIDATQQQAVMKLGINLTQLLIKLHG
jgi:chromate reductase, NAD(P)H dehydrogenase (quinone)